MGSGIGIGLLGLGTVGGGVASILQSPSERHPLVADLKLVRVAVRDLNRPRSVELPNEILTTDPAVVVNDPAVDVVVEVIGGIEPARSLILQAIAAGKSVVTANKAVIARHGEEIAEAAAKAGREAPRFVAMVPVLLSDDADAGRDTINETLEMYGQIPSYRATLDRGGAAMPADVAVIGDQQAVESGLRAYAEIGVTDFVAVIPRSAATAHATMQLVGEVARR